MGTNRKPPNREDNASRWEAMRLHQRTYATAKPCSHHPAAPRYVISRACVECVRAANYQQKLRSELGDLY